MLVVLVLVHTYDSVINAVYFQVLFKLKLQHFQLQIQLLDSWVTWVFINNLDQSAVQTVKHQPKVRKITAFMLALRKHWAKIPIKKLISVAIIRQRRQDWFWHFDNILRNDFIRLFQVLIDWRVLLLYLKLRRDILF